MGLEKRPALPDALEKANTELKEENARLRAEVETLITDRRRAEHDSRVVKEAAAQFEAQLAEAEREKQRHYEVALAQTTRADELLKERDRLRRALERAKAVMPPSYAKELAEIERLEKGEG